MLRSVLKAMPTTLDKRLVSRYDRRPDTIDQTSLSVDQIHVVTIRHLGSFESGRMAQVVCGRWYLAFDFNEVIIDASSP